MVVPYSKYQFVEVPFGLIVPLSVAEFELIELAGLVVTVGAVAAAAAWASERKTVTATTSLFVIASINSPQR